MTKWILRLNEYWNDKKLAEKCGLKVKDICIHEPEFVINHADGLHKCIKCGEFYR